MRCEYVRITNFHISNKIEYTWPKLNWCNEQNHRKQKNLHTTFVCITKRIRNADIIFLFVFFTYIHLHIYLFGIFIIYYFCWWIWIFFYYLFNANNYGLIFFLFLIILKLTSTTVSFLSPRIWSLIKSSFPKYLRIEIKVLEKKVFSQAAETFFIHHYVELIVSYLLKIKTINDI